jgi:hypothetical protein
MIMGEENQTNLNQQQGKRFALLIGVNRYADPRQFPTLEGCVNDVQSLESTLNRLSYCDVICLHEGAGEGLEPTKDNIEFQLETLAKLMAEKDTLFVHFSCHGQLYGEVPILILQGMRMESQGLQITDLKKWMCNTGAKKLILSLDACYSGAAVGRSGGDDAKFIKNVYQDSDGFVTIASSRGQQKAQELKEKKYGLYTYHLIEGLRGAADRAKKGFVTTQDLYSHILNQVREACKQTPGISQDPMYNTGGCGEIILADYQSKSSLLLKLEPNLYQIDYQDARENIDRIVGRLRRTPGPALFLLQNEKQVRGDLCLRYLRNRLDELGVGRREYPIGALDIGAQHPAVFTNKLSEHLAIEGQIPNLIDTVIDQICLDAVERPYCILSVHIKQVDQQSAFLDWFLEKFWILLVDRLEDMQQNAQEATIVGILSTDGYLVEPQVSQIACCDVSGNSRKFFDLPILAWTEDDIFRWLKGYACPTLTPNECRGIADNVYQNTEGIPIDAWLAIEDIIQNQGRNRESA